MHNAVRALGLYSASLMNTASLVPFAVPLVQIWVRSQRRRYLRKPQARSLSIQETKAFLPFFTQELLQDVRIVEVPAISEPPLYWLLAKLRVEVPLTISDIDGVTFNETVVIRRRRRTDSDWHSLLFHELVHVVQYRLLGTNLFDRYLRELARARMNYDENLFERQAYRLQSRFECEPECSFTVEAEVARELKAIGAAQSQRATK